MSLRPIALDVVLSSSLDGCPGRGSGASFPPAQFPAAPGPTPQEQAQDEAQLEAQNEAEDEYSEELRTIPSDRVSDILPDAVKLLDSAQTSFNRFLSGNSEWVRQNLKGVQEYFRIMRTLRKEVLEVIEEHQLALRKQNDQEGLVDALDGLLPAIEEKRP